MAASVGARVLIVALLALALQVPLWFTNVIVNERGARLRDVQRDVAATWTGPQQLVGPVLSMQYEIAYTARVWNQAAGEYELLEKSRWESTHLVARAADVSIDIETQRRARGIFSVPVYTGQVTMNGVFDADELRELADTIEGFVGWGPHAQLSVGISDIRGIDSSPALSWAGAEIDFEPGSEIEQLSGGLHARVPVDEAVGLEFAVAFGLRGSDALRVVPLARDTQLTVAADWPHPRFAGRFLPVQRDIGRDGFRATWRSSAISTSIDEKLARCLGNSDCAALFGEARAVEFIDPVNVYSKADRATKYGLLFVALTFMAVFITETLQGRRLHPIQYLFIGLALCIFFLLLLSLSEHLGFDTAYLLATLACSGLIGIYATGVLASRHLGSVYFAGMAALYGVLFLILRSEDFALLAGALLLFGLLAIVMTITRRTDWYGAAARAVETG